MVWNSIPAQLAKDNKKFIYSAVKKGGRAKDFEVAIQWLVDAGLVHKIYWMENIPLYCIAAYINKTNEVKGY